MGKTMLGAFFGLVMVGAGASAAFALQAGGVEIAIEIGNLKTWYPPVTIIDFKVRPGRPVLLKVTNNATADHGFEMTDATNAGAPTVMKAQVVLKPGETKYIGIPTSDMFYATQGNTLTYRCHLHPGHVGGKILMLK